MLAGYDAAMADFMADRPVNVDSSLPEALRNVILGVTYPGNQPFARELWTTDPLSLLAEVSAPVLIVIGKKDIQVDWQADGGLFESMAQDRDNITLVFPENATHVLKYEARDRSQLTPAVVMASYSANDTVLDAETVETITSWLKAHASRGKASIGEVNEIRHDFAGNSPRDSRTIWVQFSTCTASARTSWHWGLCRSRRWRWCWAISRYRTGRGPFLRHLRSDGRMVGVVDFVPQRLRGRSAPCLPVAAHDRSAVSQPRDRGGGRRSG